MVVWEYGNKGIWKMEDGRWKMKSNGHHINKSTNKQLNVIG
jgi:hypothetical protein